MRRSRLLSLLIGVVAVIVGSVQLYHIDRPMHGFLEKIFSADISEWSAKRIVVALEVVLVLGVVASLAASHLLELMHGANEIARDKRRSESGTLLHVLVFIAAMVISASMVMVAARAEPASSISKPSKSRDERVKAPKKPSTGARRAPDSGTPQR